MSKEISKQDYLKRYLENKKDSDRKNKRKVKTKSHISRLKIVDQNIDLKSIPSGGACNEDEDDEAPVVAEVIDERPLEVKVKELYESSRWKKIATNENSYSNESTTEKVSAGNDKYVGLSTSKRLHSPFENNSLHKGRHDSDDDISPPRQKSKTTHSRHDSDNGRSQIKQSSRKNRHDSDSDISPPRQSRQGKNKEKHNSDSDLSPPRKTSPSRHKKRDNSDSDISPPRDRSASSSKKRESSYDILSSRKQKKIKKRYDSDRDISSPHQQNYNKKDRLPPKSSDNFSHSDESPVRHHSSSRKFKVEESDKRYEKLRKESDSDLSPPRHDSLRTSTKAEVRAKKTLSGLKAGLQDAENLRRETQELRKREKTQINMLDDEVSGKNAETIVRDRRTGKRRDLDQERQVKDEENKKTEMHQKKYAEWGKGIEQTQNKMDKFKEDLYEMAKPLARYRDDEDLDERLKNIVHDDDPMAEYIKKKKKKDMPTVPAYNGPPPPPNRFSIPPGYRWDGVDRSNGFEIKHLEKINSAKAVQEEAYLWSVQNM